jgi:multiple antibiotic resistance protein
MNLHTQAIVTVLSLMNPVVCALMFQRIGAERSRKQRLAGASKAALAMLVVLELAALAGAKVLNIFGISLDIFSVAGGGVLLWMGFSMLRGASGSSAGHSKSSTDEPSLTPLILFAASPGTITGVITLAVAHSSSRLPVSAMVGVAVATLVTWLVMLLVAGKGANGGGGGLVRSMLQGFMGLIVMAMGAQFGLTGLLAFIATAP